MKLSLNQILTPGCKFNLDGNEYITYDVPATSVFDFRNDLDGSFIVYETYFSEGEVIIVFDAVLGLKNPFHIKLKELQRIGIVEDNSIVDKKWCIKVTNSNVDALKSYIKSRKDLASASFSEHDVIPGRWVTSHPRPDFSYMSWDMSSNPIFISIEGYSIITLEEFNIIQKLNVATETKNTPKIVGYKSPTTMKFYNVQKGEVFTCKNPQSNYFPVGKAEPWLPREIVESWEPAYELSPIKVSFFFLDSSNERKVADVFIKPGKSIRTSIGYDIIAENLQEAYNSITGEWAIGLRRVFKVETVSFGTLKGVDIKDIKNILDIYNSK